MRFRKKPVVIDAIQWTEKNILQVAAFMKLGEVTTDFLDNAILIKTLEGEMKAMPKDWIIRGVKGELYPCKPDIFEATYEPIEEAHPKGTEEKLCRRCKKYSCGGDMEFCAVCNDEVVG